ncbi:MAG: DNRLRE domain-containing protein [Candidatus Krumholzibacteriia bacterium]
MHRIVDSGDRTPWQEGTGSEHAPWPPGSDQVDAASGVAWAGAGDGGDENNQTQPDFARTPEATAMISQFDPPPDRIVRWDVTDLVADWYAGESNHGVVLRDPTGDGEQSKSFYHPSQAIAPDLR